MRKKHKHSWCHGKGVRIVLRSMVYNGKICVGTNSWWARHVGTKMWLLKLVQDRAPQAVPLHCMIHRQALAAKTILNPLRYILNQIIKMVNCAKRGELNSWFFKQTCKEMNSNIGTFFFIPRCVGCHKKILSTECLNDDKN